jgi:predicted negative regulator of RcsB-dependent stress response
VDRVTRKDLKRDKFALEVQHGLEYVSGHRRTMIRYGLIGAAVVLLVLGFYFYLRHESSLRQEALEAAMRIENATIGPAQTEYAIAYPTDADRSKAARKAWSDVASKYSGTDEGVVAEYFLGAHAADDGNLSEAQRRFQAVIDSGKTEYVSFAKLAMAQLYASQGKVAEGKKLIQSLIDHPTALVSKEAATIALAHIVATTDCDGARKLLEPLRGNERSEVSQAAIRALGDLCK